MFDEAIRAVLSCLSTSADYVVGTMPSLSYSLTLLQKHPISAITASMFGMLLFYPWLFPSRIPKGVPSPPSWPIFGSFLLLLPYSRENKTHVFFANMTDTYGPIWHLKGLDRDVIIVSDSDSVHRLLTSSSEIVRPNKLQEAAQTLFKHALFVLPSGPVWKKHRKLLQPAFGPVHLRFALRVSNEVTDAAVKIINDGIESSKSDSFVVDIHKLMTAMSLDVIGQVALKKNFKAIYSLESKDQDEVYHSFAKMMMLVQRRVFISPYIWYFSGLHNNAPLVKAVSEHAICMVREIIKERLLARSSSDEDMTKEPFNMDVIDRLLLSMGDEQGLTVDEVTDEIIGFILAGHETTANTITFIFFALCQNPHVQEKLAAEIKEVYTKLNGDITMENIMQFKYLDCVIKEAQRRYSVVQQVPRISATDIDLLGYKFKAGTLFLLRIADIHRNEHYWKDPLKFYPERWEEPCKPGTFIPFGNGPFVCIGQKMALLEIRMMVIHLLREFSFELVSGQKLEVSTSITHGFKDGLEVKATRRV
ncbi:hypothetical protein BASA61_006563 [Batrachochytrium salamandrivorans]|nr:hypothetical protein BASA62_007162 [Batrachochytrium salamandrivorans]KAH6586334.1 hypothetical protein BASA61_006563 [Batrachochytrium salamandrivorans]